MANNSTAELVVTPENLPVITHAGRPVVTTALLAKLYGTDDNNLIKNFQRNADRFVAGKHYHKLEGVELKGFRSYMTNSHVANKYARQLILWTERGAARHAKMLDTDQAWNVFEKLEDSYFGKAEAAPIEALPPADLAPVKRTVKALPNGLTLDQQEAVKALVSARVEALPQDKRAKAAITCWSALKSKFGCTYKAIDPAQFTDAISLVARLPLVGEWLAPELPSPELAKPIARLEIDFPVLRWLADNPHFAARQQFQGAGNLAVTADMLYGMDIKSPTRHLLTDLRASGYNVDACWLELLSMQHHLEVSRRTIRDMCEGLDRTMSQSLRFKLSA